MDGTPGGTVKVTDLYEASTLTATNNNIFLKARTAYGSPYELYKSDGTAAGTMIVKDVNGGRATRNLWSLQAFGNKLVFTSLSVQTGREVWISDGTTNGTKILKDLFAGEVGGVLNAGFAASGGNIFFAGDDGAHGLELWKSDGSS